MMLEKDKEGTQWCWVRFPAMQFPAIKSRFLPATLYKWNFKVFKASFDKKCCIQSRSQPTSMQKALVHVDPSLHEFTTGTGQNLAISMPSMINIDCTKLGLWAFTHTQQTISQCRGTSILKVFAIYGAGDLCLTFCISINERYQISLRMYKLCKPTQTEPQHPGRDCAGWNNSAAKWSWSLRQCDTSNMQFEGLGSNSSKLLQRDKQPAIKTKNFGYKAVSTFKSCEYPLYPPPPFHPTCWNCGCAHRASMYPLA